MTQPKTAAIILAAGLGTRMNSAIPKVLHPLAGRPMIAWLTETLVAMNVERVVVVVGPDMDAVADAVVPAEVVVQTEPLGTGHAVLAARDALEGFDGDVLVLFGGDPLVPAEIMAAMVAARRATPEPAVVVLAMRPDDPARYGRLVVDGDGVLSRIIEFRDADAEQRAIGLCNAGIMAIDGNQLFNLLDQVSNDNTKGEYYLTDIVAVARDAGLHCTVVDGGTEPLPGIDSRAELAAVEALVQDRLRAAAMAGGVTMTDPASVFLSYDTAFGRDVLIEPNVFFGPGVTVGDNVRIRAFCHLEGAVLGDGVTVGPHARLRPGATIGRDARIGNFVEVKNAVIEASAKVNHLAYVGDARVGEGANVGAGAITCNYDGVSKSHTDIGAGAFIGSNVAIVAPVTIGDGAIIGAGSVVSKDVPADAVATSRAPQDVRQGTAAKLRRRKQAAKARK
ncbi:MAG: bifunctional UDP-N-acetylglucosamine diphosphorylase/glucosamine-1-phosphate N-acetyltransferase GlmU [Pseudomonadota bacterium]|nr:bifunctional UDP-N-acetylglucosamine diphosphorylase/glucosamine-1-phosphate N-acetyltransferase GlmU [Pseudomonadota bacterium]